MTDAPEKRLSARDVADRLDRVVESTNAQFDRVSGALDQITGALGELTKAIHRPVVTQAHDEFDAASAAVGQDGAAHFDASGHLVKSRLTDVNSPEFKAKADMDAFMRETVLVKIHEVSERDAAQSFEISVNGEKYVFRRGDTRRIPRYIVERLALARPVHYRNEKRTNSEGVDEYFYPSHRGLRYQFSVLEDSDRGKKWLEHRLLAA